MTTEVSDPNLALELPLHPEKNRRRRRSRHAIIVDVIGCLTVIVFFAGVFFALKLCLELGLHLVTQEMKERVSANRGY